MEMPSHTSYESLLQRYTQLELAYKGLESLNAELRQQIAEISDKARWLEERLQLAVRQRFSPSTERFCSGQGLLDICENAVPGKALAEELERPSADEETKASRPARKWQGQRKAKLEHLKVETVEYRLPDHELACSCCNGQLHEMTKEVRRELNITPPEVKVVEHVRYSYSCRHCANTQTETPILTAPMPNPVLPGSLASPSALSFIMCQKFIDAVPLYRQEKQMERHGLELSRQTMSNWMLCGANWLELLYRRMHHYLLQRDVLHADETRLQVLREPGRAAETQSFLWLYRSSRAGPHIILFDYQQTRAAKQPQQFLRGFSGYLHVDGYAGYEGLPKVELVGCWAHARRKFVEAAKALPSSSNNPRKPAALEGLEYCNALFKIEAGLDRLTPEERYAARQERSLPIIEDFRSWLEQHSGALTPKGITGRAIGYCLNQWSKLTTFLKDGRLEISNNRAENAIRPVAVGRKNWLFANTPEGARASAVIFSMIETAKANGVNPLGYLTYLFEQLPNQGNISDPATLDGLLPWSDTIQSTFPL
jgi:transposase